jgi:hypothetical protein
MKKTLLTCFALMTLAAVSVNAQIINEVLADPHPDQPPLSPNGDANGDGTRDGSHDEFVEIYNDTGAALNLSGWTLNDAVGVRHTFPPGSTLTAGCAIVVFGGGTPTGTFGGSIVQTASTGFLGLNNGGDTLTLYTDLAVPVTTMTYPPPNATDQSLNREPDITGATFVGHSAHSASGGTVHSPGTRADGTAFGSCGIVAAQASAWSAVKSLYRGN